MILKIILVLIVLLLIKVFKFMIKFKKDGYKLYDEFVEEMAEFVYDNFVNPIKLLKDNSPIKLKILNHMEMTDKSRNNFLECVKDIYFNYLYRKKKSYKNVVLALDGSKHYLDAIPDTKHELLVEFEKYYIGLGLFAHYHFNMDEPNIVLDPNFYRDYVNTLEYIPFTKYTIGSKCTVSHANGIYSVKKIGEDLKFKLSNLCSGRDNLYAYTVWNNANYLYYNRDNRDETYIDKLLEVESLDELKDYKEYYSEFLKKDVGNSFDSILEDDNCLPISHFNDLEIFDGLFMKVLMYYNIKKQKIEFKEFIKEVGTDSYHTINKSSTYPLLLVMEYIMYFESCIFCALSNDKIKRIKEETGCQ